MISDVAGVKLPKFEMPETLTMVNSYILTGLANLIKKPPMWGMATGQMKVMRTGFNADGSKTERELGIKYTPIPVALKEAIESLR